VTGTPTTEVDGIYEYVGGGTGNYSQYRSAFNSRKGIDSPFEINLSGSYFHWTCSGSVTAEIIATGSPPSNIYLRYAVIETDMEYGWSGEDSLYFVERSMFPSASGVSISLSQGDTITDTRAFTLDPSWDFFNSSIAVFIQRDATKEVQQAAQWELPVSGPDISFAGEYIDDSSGDNDHRADPGETVDMIVSIFNTPGFLEATGVTATISTNDPDITITNATASFPNVLPDSTVDNTADPFTFSVSSSAGVHWAEFTINVNAQPNGYHITDTFELMIGRPDIVFVDNDGGETFGNIEAYFYAAIESLGFIYDRIYNTSVEMQYLDEYQVIVWFTGALDSGTVTGNDQTLLSSYLDGGGNLFVTGQNIGKDIGSTSFYSDYLHASFKTDDVNYYGILGVAGDPIGDGLVFTITGVGGANNQGSPSAINKVSDSDSCLTYPGTLGPCGVRHSSTYKTVYFSFGYEAISDESKRIELLRRILVWFGFIQGIEGEPSYDIAQKPAICISPNPFNSSTTISLSGIEHGAKGMELHIFDISGRLVRALACPMHQASCTMHVSWNGRDEAGRELPRGIYFLNAKVGSTRFAPRKLILVR
jgi:hypothetical protein